MFLLAMDFLITFGIYATPKLLKCVTLSQFTWEGIQVVSIDLYSSTLITCDHPLFRVVK